MNILVLGSGGREHSLSFKLSKSEKVRLVACMPGNPGMARDSKIKVLNQNPNDFDSLVETIRKLGINLVVVGPENLLAIGVVDFLRDQNIAVVGPTKKAAQLESSKIFSKILMKKYSIPTAESGEFSDYKLALEFVQNCTWADGLVVKCDGLAAGKGVVVCDSKEQALNALQDFMVKDTLGLGNTKVVIEERLIGKEVSCFSLCDGEHSMSLGFACDHKTLREGNEGPNTGGMGTYSGVDWLAVEQEDYIKEHIVDKTLQACKAEGHPFTGILFTGLMITKNGPKVLEYNVRFGDPETQSLLPLIESDLADYFYAAANGTLDQWSKISKSSEHAVHVVLAAYGYPGTEGIAVRKGDEIVIPEINDEKVKVYYAGVKEINGRLLSDGGRVLGVTALGNTQNEARERAYYWADKIELKDKQIRRDVGL